MSRKHPQTDRETTWAEHNGSTCSVALHLIPDRNSTPKQDNCILIAGSQYPFANIYTHMISYFHLSACVCVCAHVLVERAADSMSQQTSVNHYSVMLFDSVTAASSGHPISMCLYVQDTHHRHPTGNKESKRCKFTVGKVLEKQHSLFLWFVKSRDPIVSKINTSHWWPQMPITGSHSISTNAPPSWSRNSLCFGWKFCFLPFLWQRYTTSILHACVCVPVCLRLCSFVNLWML